MNLEINNSYKTRNTLWLSILWLACIIYFKEPIFEYLNFTKYEYIKYFGIIWGQAIYCIQNLALIFPFVIMLSICDVDPLYKLNYLILSEKFLILKLVNKLIYYTKTLLNILFYLSLLLVLLCTILYLVDPSSIKSSHFGTNLISYWNKPFILLSENSENHSSVGNYFTNFINIPILTFLTFPIFIFLIFNQCYPIIGTFIFLTVLWGFRKSINYDDRDLELYIAEDESTIIDLNKAKPITKKDYNILVSKVKSKEYLFQILFKIDELKVLYTQSKL